MVAAIAISIPVFMMIQAFGNIFAVGASLISRLLGQGEREGASRAGAVSFWSAAIVCTIVSIIGLIYIKPILLSCGASANTIGYGKSYLRIMLMGSPFIGLKMALAGLLRSEGATREAMIGMISGSLLNIALDPIFIFLLKMGVAGAAVATVIGNIVGFSYCLSFYTRKKGSFQYLGIISVSIGISTRRFSNRYTASIAMLLTSTIAVNNVYAVGFGDELWLPTGWPGGFQYHRHALHGSGARLPAPNGLQLWGPKI